MKQKRMLKRKRGKKNEKNDNKGGNAKKNEHRSPDMKKNDSNRPQDANKQNSKAAADKNRRKVVLDQRSLWKYQRLNLPLPKRRV